MNIMLVAVVERTREIGVRGFLDFPAQVTPGIVMLGIALAVAVGLAAGYWPARNASNLAVVDALRDE